MSAEAWLSRHDPRRRRKPKRPKVERSHAWFAKQGKWRWLLKYHYERRPKGFELTGAFLERLWSAQEGRCGYCLSVLGDDPDNFVLEHMTPLSRGGFSRPDNVCWACNDCNVRKYTKTAEEFMGPSWSPGSSSVECEAPLSGDASTGARMVRRGVRALRRRRRTK
jgi:hypothetical protein